MPATQEVEQEDHDFKASPVKVSKIISQKKTKGLGHGSKDRALA
jgi:hypothetical protein